MKYLFMILGALSATAHAAPACDHNDLADAFRPLRQFTSSDTAEGWIAGTETKYFSLAANLAGHTLTFREFLDTNLGWQKEKAHAGYAIDQIGCVPSDDPAYEKAYQVRAHLVRAGMSGAPKSIIWTIRMHPARGYCGTEDRSTIEVLAADGTSVKYLDGSATQAECEAERDNNNNGYGQ